MREYFSGTFPVPYSLCHHFHNINITKPSGDLCKSLLEWRTLFRDLNGQTNKRNTKT